MLEGETGDTEVTSDSDLENLSDEFYYERVNRIIAKYIEDTGGMLPIPNREDSPRTTRAKKEIKPSGLQTQIIDLLKVTDRALTAYEICYKIRQDTSALEQRHAKAALTLLWRKGDLEKSYNERGDDVFWHKDLLAHSVHYRPLVRPARPVHKPKAAHLQPSQPIITKF